jgi:hypothetical protein
MEWLTEKPTLKQTGLIWKRKMFNTSVKSLFSPSTSSSPGFNSPPGLKKVIDMIKLFSLPSINASA